MKLMKNRKPIVITIDGLSGVGKGTITQRLSMIYHFHLLDSGAIYRVLALAIVQANIPLQDVMALEQAAQNLNVEFVAIENQALKILLNQQDVTDEIRTEPISQMASKVAAIPEVRVALLDRQRAFQQSPGLIAEGRDMGSTVFPEAEVKLFLTASQEVRAKRRYEQLLAKGFDVKLSDLMAALIERDQRDQQRQASPTVVPKDAVVIDTSELTIDEVTAYAESVINKKLKVLGIGVS
jgi:CMP/dCMP kinase